MRCKDVKILRMKREYKMRRLLVLKLVESSDVLVLESRNVWLNLVKNSRQKWFRHASSESSQWVPLALSSMSVTIKEQKSVVLESSRLEACSERS